MKKIIYLLLLISLLVPGSSVFAANAQPKIWGEPEFFSYRDEIFLSEVEEELDIEVYQYDAEDTYACEWVNQQPQDYAVVKSRQAFDMNWTVVNSGSAVWHAGSTFVSYYGGFPMHTHTDSYALTETVSLGEKLHVRIDMEAPKEPGTYTTTWALLTGNTRICRMFLIITVK